MITGKDKERVRTLEVHSDLSRHLFENIEQDLVAIMNALEEDGIDAGGDTKYWKIPYDVGRCRGMIEILSK